MIGKNIFTQLVSKLQPFYKMLTELLAGQEIKKQQIDEAEEALEGLKRASEVVVKRKQHYQTLIAKGLNKHEKLHIDKLESFYEP